MREFGLVRGRREGKGGIKIESSWFLGRGVDFGLDNSDVCVYVNTCVYVHVHLHGLGVWSMIV